MNEVFFGFSFFFLIIGTLIISGIIYFMQNYLSLFDIVLSMNQYLWTNFRFSSSNDKFDNLGYLGPFHLWSGREDKNCVEMDGDRCKKWETTHLNNSVNLFKISNNYLTFVPYKTYLEVLEKGYIISEDRNCPNELKYCGKIDTLNQKLCLPTNIECPIQDFQISNMFKEGYNNIQYSYNGMTEYISYTNQNTDFFIIGNISIGSGPPCINKLEENWKKLENKEINETSYCKTEFEEVKYDKRYKKCGKLSYINIYQSNLPKDVFNIMYNSIDGHYLEVYKRPYIGINLSCYLKSTYNIKAHIDSKETINSLQELIFLYFKSLIILIIYFIGFSKCCRGTPELQLFVFITLIIFFLVFLVKYINIEIEFLYLITDFNCSDEYTNSLIQFDNEKIKTNMILILTIIVILLISVITFIILFIKNVKEECCKTHDHDYNKNNENELSQSINNVNNINNTIN